MGYSEQERALQITLPLSQPIIQNRMFSYFLFEVTSFSYFCISPM